MRAHDTRSAALNSVRHRCRMPDSPASARHHGTGRGQYRPPRRRSCRSRMRGSSTRTQLLARAHGGSRSTRGRGKALPPKCARSSRHGVPVAYLLGRREFWVARLRGDAGCAGAAPGNRAVGLNASLHHVRTSEAEVSRRSRHHGSGAIAVTLRRAGRARVASHGHRFVGRCRRSGGAAQRTASAPPGASGGKTHGRRWFTPSPGVVYFWPSSPAQSALHRVRRSCALAGGGARHEPRAALTPFGAMAWVRCGLCHQWRAGLPQTRGHWLRCWDTACPQGPAVRAALSREELRITLALAAAILAEPRALISGRPSGSSPEGKTAPMLVLAPQRGTIEDRGCFEEEAPVSSADFPELASTT